MNRIILIIIALFLCHSEAYACSCWAKGVMPISDMLEEYDHVFIAQVDEAIDYNNNHWPVNWTEGLNEKEISQQVRIIRPTKRAKITISEVFKGELEGTVELTFKADGSNCAGGYYFQGETTLFFLYDVGDGFVRAGGYCSSSSQYLYSTDQIREYAKNGTNPNLLSKNCHYKLRSAERFGSKYIDDFQRQNCAAYYDAYKAGKFVTSQERKPK